MVQRAQAILTGETALEYNTKIDLINTILTITEGKVRMDEMIRFERGLSLFECYRRVTVSLTA